MTATEAVPDLAGLLAARPQVWGRVVLAVAAMHQPDERGNCRYCRPADRPRRWWRRRCGPTGPCPTWRMLAAEAVAEAVAEPAPCGAPA